jgi:antibiotic biosynthesis monooxygenase (ABM) superfamily enzyme
MIRVIIERHVAEGLEQPYEQTIKKVMARLKKAPGYISGEELKDQERPNHYFVIANWLDIDSWRLWSVSADRKALLEEISPFLANPEKCTILSPIKTRESVVAKSRSVPEITTFVY